VTIQQILLIGHTHHDVGYTASPRTVDAMHARIVGRVLELCGEHGEPGPAQFRWTFEVARPVLNFLDSAAPQDAARLAELVRAGRISVTGGYLNMTQLPGEAEFDAAYRQLERIRRHGIEVRTEQHGDVNGIAWGLVPAMRRAGLQRLVMALNPDHGRAPFAQPTGFHWAGPDGASVFVWLSTHYGFGEEWGIVDGHTELAERSIAAFVARLNDRDDYPYSIALVHAANDNRWPTSRFLDVVRHWNQARPDIPMRTATIDDALDLLIDQAAGAAIPTVRGEWSDWWSHGHGSTAREVAVYRRARGHALAAQAMLGLTELRGDGEPALAEVIGYRRGPVRLRSASEVRRDLDLVDEQLLLFGEHTWGSWETYRRPHSDFSFSHWNAKAGFAYAAYDLGRELAVEGLFRLVASGPEPATPGGSGTEHSGTEHSGTEHSGTGPADRLHPADSVTGVIVVVNPTERQRSEPVTVEIDGSALRTMLALDVPAFGTAAFAIPVAPRDAGRGREIQAGDFRVVVDPARGGAISLLDLRDGRELIDPTSPHGLGAVVVQQIPPGCDHPMLTEDPRRFRPADPGPEFTEVAASGSKEPRIERAADHVAIRWWTSAPGMSSISSTLRLYPRLDVIDVQVDLVKPEAFGPESIFVAFPFAGRDPEFWLETAGAVYRAETEQLPDTSRDWYSIQHAVGLRAGGKAVLWGSSDAPLVQLGGFHTGRWARHLEASSGQLNSWLMNNLHFTNFQARQDGTGSYHYRIRPLTGNVDDAQWRRLVSDAGRNLLQPLVARQYAGPLRLAGASGLRVLPADRVHVQVRPADDGVRVTVRNTGPDALTAQVIWAPALGADRRIELDLDGYGARDALIGDGIHRPDR
jgi:hypothetical protein